MDLVLIYDQEISLNSLRKCLTKDYEVTYLNDFNIKNVENYKKIYVFTDLMYDMPKSEIQDFILQDEFKNTKLNLVLVSDSVQNTKITHQWIAILKSSYGFNLEIVGEVVRDQFIEDFDLFFKTQKYTSTLQNATNKNNNVTIYTDGACSGNPGPGGWGAILMQGDHKLEISGYEKMTTNNRMELMAVISALSKLKTKCNVDLYSDSTYVVSGITEHWIEKWIKNGWKTADKSNVKNLDLWLKFNELINYHNVTFFKVKGHADNEYNNRADELATGEIAKHR